jgi:hypothetical protein
MVPHARRVETLTHHELLKEWRRERKCRDPRCHTQHEEWFEVSRHRAIQVITDWAEFIERAEPYHTNGSLKTEWKTVVESLEASRRMVTARGLLRHYEGSLIGPSTSTERSLIPEEPPAEDTAASSPSPRPNAEIRSDPIQATLKQLDDACADLKDVQDRIASTTQRLRMHLGVQAEAPRAEATYG